MGKRFGDITIYDKPYVVGTPEYNDHVTLQNFICDLYVQRMYRYKPPGATRMSILPAHFGHSEEPSMFGSIVSISSHYDHDEFCSLDKKGQYKYILDLIQTATLRTSEYYNWDKQVFERAYKEILESDFEFRIVYPAKLSKDRKKRGQVIIEKTLTTTTLSLSIQTGNETKVVKVFDNKNWFWYDKAYALAENTKWFDNNTFGVFSRRTDRVGHYSLTRDVITFEPGFSEDELKYNW